MIKQSKLCVGGTWDGEKHTLPFYPRIVLPCKGQENESRFIPSDVKDIVSTSLKTEEYDMLTLSDSGYYLSFYKLRGLSDMQALDLLIEGYRNPHRGTST